jgi:hypothetical protein
LYRYADAVDKLLAPVFLLQLFIKLRCKYSQKLGVTRDERAMGVGSTKNDSVTRSTAEHRTTEVALDPVHARTRLYELNAKRRDARTRAEASGREHPGEAAFDKHRGLDLICKEPAELDAPFVIALFLYDLFRAGELLKASHLVYSGTKVLGRKRDETDGVKSFSFCFCAEPEANCRIGADFAHGTPESKQFLGVEQNASSINKPWGKSGPPQDLRSTDSQFFQLGKGAAGDAKVLIHQFTQI